MNVVITTAMWAEFVEVSNTLNKFISTNGGESFDSTELFGKSSCLYKTPNLNLVLLKTGVGGYNSIQSLNSLFKVDFIVNVGYAAASRIFTVGQILIPYSFVGPGFRREPDTITDTVSRPISFEVLAKLADNLEGKGFILVDKIMTSPMFVTRDNINVFDPDRLCQLYDMESYYQALFAKSHNIDFISVKRVSDIPEDEIPSTHIESFNNNISSTDGLSFSFLEKLLSMLR